MMKIFKSNLQKLFKKQQKKIIENRTLEREFKFRKTLKVIKPVVHFFVNHKISKISVKVSSETQISTGVMVAEANQSRRTKRFFLLIVVFFIVFLLV